MTSRRGGGSSASGTISSSSTSNGHHHEDHGGASAELAPLTQPSACNSPDEAMQGTVESAPPGRWKHGLYNVFQYGTCHPSSCQSCCCVPLAATQVLNRLGLSWQNRKGARLFQFLLAITVAFWINRVVLFLLIALLDPNIDSPEWIEPGFWYYVVCIVDDSLALIYFAFSVYLLRYARSRVRQRHSISEGETCPTGCEDTCCSLFCSCCVASQLLRQTADYGVSPARCCTEHGLLVLSPSQSSTLQHPPSNGSVELV